MNTLMSLGSRSWKHLRYHKWTYVFAVMAWVFAWYASMNVLTLLQPSALPPDIMPLVAGAPIIFVGWRVLALDQQLNLVIENFDEGAAFAFPSGQSNAKQEFIRDLKSTISWWSKFVALMVLAISIGGIISLLVKEMGGSDSSFSLTLEGDSVRFLLTALLACAIPAISLPIGLLLGKLVGYAQLLRVVDRNGIEFAGLSTPPAREALRGLQGVYILALVTTMAMCLWFAAWWINWAFNFEEPYFFYEVRWKTLFMTFWGVSLLLFIAAAVLPSWSFKQRIARLQGGREGGTAAAEQLRQAESDLNALHVSSTELPRLQREHIYELEHFIANLKDQRIESWLLDWRLHAGFFVLNALLFVLPPLIARELGY